MYQSNNRYNTDSQAFRPGDVDLSASASLAAAATTDDTRFFGAVQEEAEFPELADTAYAQRLVGMVSVSAAVLQCCLRGCCSLFCHNE
jgi:hypothetical protein